jgi:FkbM family methyltransferase
MKAIGYFAGFVARVLSSSWPAGARRFGYWYRAQTVLHPRWCAPIRWESRVRLADGSCMTAPFNEVQGMSLILDGCWEPELTGRIISALKPGDVFVDVGANMGYYAMLASTTVGDDGLVLAFEPSPSNLQMLLKNLRLNRSANVVVLNLALSDQDSVAKLWGAPYYNTGVCSLRGPDFAASPSDFTLTPTARLAGIGALKSLWPRIRLIKIDVEGLELPVLRGAEELLRANERLQLTCEISPQWCQAAELVNYLRTFGFCGEYYEGGGWHPLLPGELPREQCNAWFWHPETALRVAEFAGRGGTRECPV